MDALVITLREGVEAALVIGIILAYLSKAGRSHLNRYAYAGLGVAVAFSLVTAFTLKAAGIDPENEVVEGVLYLTASVFVGSMVAWMWKTGRQLKQHMETRMATLVSSERADTLQAIGIFAFTFFMIAREGVETVLFLSAISFVSTSQIMTFIGAVSGLVLALGFGILFVRGSIKIHLHSFFTATSIVLLLLALRFLAGGIHEFREIGLLKLDQSVMSAIGFIVRDNTSMWLLIGLLAIPMLTTGFAALKKPVANTDTDSQVEKRKEIARLKRERRWTLGAVGFTALVITILFGALATADQTYEPPIVPMGSENGSILIKGSSLEDGKLYKYAYKAGGTEVRFLIVKRDNGYGVGLDACEVCGPKGYVQEKDNLICKNCNAPILVGSVGEPGGCNPIVLKHTASSSIISIDATDLEKAAVFK